VYDYFLVSANAVYYYDASHAVCVRCSVFRRDRIINLARILMRALLQAAGNALVYASSLTVPRKMAISEL
jgi:hypothetical protein